MSYKHYNPKDILMLDDERINRIIYQDRLVQLKNIMNLLIYILQEKERLNNLKLQF